MTNTAIKTDGLTRTFGDLVAVNRLNLEIPVGGVTGFVGPNGSGKSTTIRILMGLISPTAGTAEVLGESIKQPIRYARRVGALIESPAFVPNISAKANVASMALLRGVPGSRVDAAIEMVGLRDRAQSKVSEYSLGMKQRLGIAIALLADPDILILDEPTNGLDPAGIVEIRSLLRRLGDEGKTVLVSSHLLSEIEAAADRLVVIRFGELLFSGPIRQLFNEAIRYVEVEPEHPSDLATLAARYRADGRATETIDSALRVTADPDNSVELNRAAIQLGVTLRRLEPHSETLEEVFLRITDEPLSA